MGVWLGKVLYGCWSPVYVVFTESTLLWDTGSEVLRPCLIHGDPKPLVMKMVMSKASPGVPCEPL